MRKLLTPTEYKEKFDRLFFNYIYVMGNGEKIVQCQDPYPSYWFISNRGFLFSVYQNQIHLVKPNVRETGKKNLDGKRAGVDWYYEYRVEGEKNNRHVTAHKLISDHFLESEFPAAAELEVHHIKKRKSFQPEESHLCNCVDNLQLLPKDIHKRLTTFAGKTSADRDAEMQEKIEKSGCPVFYLTEEALERLLFAALNCQYAPQDTPTIYMMSEADDVGKIEAEAHPIIMGGASR